MEVPTAHGLVLSSSVQCISELRRLEHLTIRSNTAKTENWFLSLLRACLPLPGLSELYCKFVIESDHKDGSEDDLENEPESEFAKDITEPEAELKTILEEAITARASINGSIDVKIKALEFPDPEKGDIIRIVVPLLMSDLVEVETLKVPKLIPVRGVALDLGPFKGRAFCYPRVLQAAKAVLDSAEWIFRVQFQHILENEWVCLGLRELSLTLNRHIDLKAAIEAMRQESSGKAVGREELAYDKLSNAEKIELALKASTWAAKRMCTQIGRLVALETLALGADEEDVPFSKCDLTLSAGHLAELAGLKKLCQLHLRTDYWSKMGQAEVEFMYANWPSLDRVCFGTTGSRPLGLNEQIHWQWLLQKRPQLRFGAFIEK
ncbi:hypothetical protein BGZ68_008952 [Mortierella alpina]|nr:hypothetical protein BGZ68_008952 [Mortierella alpina]